MQKAKTYFTGLLAAIVAAAAIFGLTLLLAKQVESSRIWRQSKIISMLVQQDSLDLRGVLDNTRNINMLVKFAGALASGYINFELIPVNEASTFMTVFESLPDDIDIESFAYHRKDLQIRGFTADLAAYQRFMADLQARAHFDSVTGHYYDSTDGKIQFEITCSAKVVEAYLPFS